MTDAFINRPIKKAARECWEKGWIPSPAYMSSPEILREHAVSMDDVSVQTLRNWIDEAEQLSEANLARSIRKDYISTGIAFGTIVLSAFTLKSAFSAWANTIAIHEKLTNGVSSRFSEISTLKCASSVSRTECAQSSYASLVDLNQKQQLIDAGASLLLTAVFAFSAWKCRKISREYTSEALHLRDLSETQLMQSWHIQDVLDDRNKPSADPS